MKEIDVNYPGLSPDSPECMDRFGLALAHLESKCTNFYDSAEVERVFYPEIERLLLEFFPDATDALVYNHDVPGVNVRYVNLVHNDLNDDSGRVRCRELLTRNLFGRTQNYTEEEADAKMSRRFVSLNLAKPMETVEQAGRARRGRYSSSRRGPSCRVRLARPPRVRSPESGTPCAAS